MPVLNNKVHNLLFTLDVDEKYMMRCLQLAKLGAGKVAPNPMVGAVLFNDNRIIGEGYHKQFGFAHAEVNCIESVKKEDQHKLEESTLYVSLEPCSHFGKTPPCTDLIIKNKIPKVVIGIKDPFEQVNGSGIDKLIKAGVEVKVGVLSNECYDLNKRFFVFHQKKRPFIILKWAQSSNGFIGKPSEQIFISNEYTNRLVHKWRSEESGIMAGTNTIIIDDPKLTNRYWFGNDPVRLIVDKSLRIAESANVYDRSVKTVIFNTEKEVESDNLILKKLRDTSIKTILSECFKMNIQSILVEGGLQLLQSFINEGYWDEARVITGNSIIIDNGISAPQLTGAELISNTIIESDTVRIYKNRK